MMDKRARTRQTIIQKSAPLFNTYGYAGTSMSDVLNVAGYSKGALYNVFEDKEELAKEAFKHNLGKLHHAFLDKIEQAESSIDKLLAIPSFYETTIVDTIVTGGCPILNTAIESDDTHPAMNTLVKNAFDEWRKIITETIKVGKSNGEFNKDLNEEELSFFIIASIEGSIALAKSYTNRDILKTNMRNLKKYILGQI